MLTVTPHQPPPDLPEIDPELLIWDHWLIELRWFAVLLGIPVIILAQTNHMAGPGAGLWLLLGVALLYNTLFWLHGGPRRHPCQPIGQRGLQRSIQLQLLCDVVVVVIALHLSDSLENPFVMALSLPAALAAALLPGRQWIVVPLTAFSLQTLSVSLEFQGLITHHSVHPARLGQAPDLFFENGFAVLGYIAALGVMLFLIPILMAAVATKRRNADEARRNLDALAQARARMARVGMLSAGVAHAIRNPLHGLMNSLDLITKRLKKLAPAGASDSSDSSGGAELAELGGLVELMDESLQRIARITQRLLTLSREGPLNPRLTKLEDLVADSVGLISPQRHARNVTVHSQVEAIEPLMLDADRLSEALINLLDNAVAASEVGGTVWIRAYSGQLGAQRAVCLEVKDEGRGISANDLPHVFDPFFTTKAIGEGTGLGLAICQHVVERHGGLVEVESSSGEGTTIRFKLPSSASASATKQEPQPKD